MVTIEKEQREEIRKLVQNAVSIQVQLYNALGEIEAVTGLLSGLDDEIRREASDWMNPEDVKIDDSTLDGMFADVEKEA